MRLMNRCHAIAAGRACRPTAAAMVIFAMGGMDMASAHAQPAGAAVQRGAAASPAPGTMFLHPERIRLADGSFAEADRGVLYVPINRSRPDAGVIGIEIYRFRAAPGARSQTPPIFRLPGGPSFAGLGSSLSNRGYYEREIEPWLQVADLVVVGQRGIGTSKPTTTCAPPAPSSLNATVADRAAAQQEAARRCKEYWQAAGLDLSGFTVIEAAADVNDVRQALGYSTIQISGGSFGSHWGMAVMRYHPEIVTRALLHGLEGPDHTYDMPSGILNSLANIAAAADTAATLRDWVPGGGLMQALRQVIERLDQEPATVILDDRATGRQDTVTLDGDAIRAVAKGYTGGPASWPANVLALYHGDYSGAAQALLRARRSPGLQTASYFMLDCGSGISDERLSIMNADTAVAIVGDLEWSYRVNCPVWGADLGNAFRRNFESDIPTMFVHGDRDLSTPLENALELVPYFSSSTFTLVRGGSHAAFAEALRTFPSFRRAVNDFFATGSMTEVPEELVMPPVNWTVPETRPSTN